MNPMVPDCGENLDDWYKAINSMFGDVVQCNCAGFDADLDMTPPFVTHMPPNNLHDCFIFNEIKTDISFNYDHTQITLMELIESSINMDMVEPRDTSKSTIVWRVKPEINLYLNFDKNVREEWSGYARVRVLDKYSSCEFGYFWGRR